MSRAATERQARLIDVDSDQRQSSGIAGELRADQADEALSKHGHRLGERNHRFARRIHGNRTDRAEAGLFVRDAFRNPHGTGLATDDQRRVGVPRRKHGRRA
jgi:hypothetical protein